VVSAQAGRLWREIERYYLTGGKNDSIRIDIPKGIYVPVFEKRPPTQTIEASIAKDFI
jgi:adenylate cyclase